MSIDEFKEQVVPIVDELKEYCTGMSEVDFVKFKAQAIKFLPMKNQGVQQYIEILFSYLHPQNK